MSTRIPDIPNMAMFPRVPSGKTVKAEVRLRVNQRPDALFMSPRTRSSNDLQVNKCIAALLG
jgi:hypothetical protein